MDQAFRLGLRSTCTMTNDVSRILLQKMTQRQNFERSGVETARASVAM